MQRLHDVMTWLDAGLPLTLVIDLLDENGPNSTQILHAERPLPAELAWLSGPGTGAIAGFSSPGIRGFH